MRKFQLPRNRIAVGTKKFNPRFLIYRQIKQCQVTPEDKLVHNCPRHRLLLVGGPPPKCHGATEVANRLPQVHESSIKQIPCCGANEVRLSIRSLRRTTMSWSVTVVSSTGKWNVWDFYRHHFTNEVTKAWSMVMAPRRDTPYKPSWIMLGLRRSSTVPYFFMRKSITRK